MRPRDPRRLLARRRYALARVKIVDVPESEGSEDGSVTTKQTAEVTLPREELDRIWSPEYLERLARTYWRFLSRVSLGVLRVLYTEDAREIAVFTRPFVLLRFHKPEYEMGEDCGVVTWPIEKGLLVQSRGRGKGFLRITVRRFPEKEAGEDAVGEVSSEVANFYPTIAGRGKFARIGQAIYRMTQFRIHIIVTHAFLRSLARMDLEESKVGALREPEQAASQSAPRSESAASPDRA